MPLKYDRFSSIIQTIILCCLFLTKCLTSGSGSGSKLPNSFLWNKPDNIRIAEKTAQGGVQYTTENESMWEETADKQLIYKGQDGIVQRKGKVKSIMEDETANMNKLSLRPKAKSLLQYINPDDVVKAERTEQGGVQYTTGTESLLEQTADKQIVYRNRHGKIEHKKGAAKSLLANAEDGTPKKTQSLLKNKTEVGKASGNLSKAQSLLTDSGDGKPTKVDSLLMKFVDPKDVAEQQETEQGGVQLKTVNNSLWERTADDVVAHLDRQGNLTKNVKAKSLLNRSATTGGLPPKVPKGPRSSAATSIGDSSNRLSEYVESLPFVDKDGTRFRVLKVDKSETGHYVVSDKAASAKTLMYFDGKESI